MAKENESFHLNLKDNVRDVSATLSSISALHSCYNSSKLLIFVKEKYNFDIFLVFMRKLWKYWKSSEHTKKYGHNK